MSYGIALREGNNICSVERHIEGCNIQVGGSTEAHILITYNYGPHYYKHIDPEKGLRWLYGKRASETIERLESAIAALGTERADDYWAPTKGNAGYALSILLGWARMHPDAIWSGD